MNLKSLIEHLNFSDFVNLSEIQYAELKKNSELIFEENTIISDFIRIFKYKDFYIFQEQTLKGEILLRKFDKKSAALALVNQRLDIYEKMWNGCGCKIDYYSA